MAENCCHLDLAYTVKLKWRLDQIGTEGFSKQVVFYSKGLVTNYGEGRGGYKTGGGACEVLPLRKGGGGGGTSFSHAEGGAQKVLG